jgi:hypothetical protein
VESVVFKMLKELVPANLAIYPDRTTKQNVV